VKPALLVIDMQKEFFSIDEVTKKSLEDALEYIDAAVDLFRERNLPVVWVQDVDEEDGRVPGTEGFELHESLKPDPGDIVIHKTYGNAFNKTALERDLKKLEVDTLILTGFCAENCVLSTCRGALDLDFTPVLFRGSLASIIPDNIRFVESINDIISYQALKKLLETV